MGIADSPHLTVVDQLGGDYRHASLLLYGKDLSGKTTTAAAASQYRSCLTISVEDGTRRISGRVAYAHSAQGVDEAVQFAIAGGYQAVAFDTLDRAYAMGMEAAGRGELACPPHLGSPIAFREGKVDDKRVKDPRFLHLLTLTWLIGHVRRLHAAPCLSLFTAHAREEVTAKDEKGNATAWGVRLDLPPRFAGLVRDTMDGVFYLFRVGTGERRFFADTVTISGKTFYAKDRTDRFVNGFSRGHQHPLSFDYIAQRLNLDLTLRDDADMAVGVVPRAA